MERLLGWKALGLTLPGWLAAVAIGGAGLAACDDGGDGDADADADADTDVDGDSDADEDGDVAAPPLVGINLDAIDGWNEALVDMGRAARAFEAIGEGELAVDERGWPLEDARTAIFDRRPYPAWTGAIDDPERFTPDMSGSYLVSFTGRATVDEVESDDVTVQNVLYTAETNRTTLELVVSASADEWSNVAVLELTDTEGGVRDLRVTRPGYAHDTTETFHQPFLDALRYASFGAIGFAEWTRTNGNNPAYPARTEWADRALLDAATYESGAPDHEVGVPWELVVALANEVDKDIWVNVPVAASDGYVTGLATLLRDGLEPELHVYLEHSYEVWNSIHSQHEWHRQHAEALGLTLWQANARRSLEIAEIFADVFGAAAINDRVRVVLSGQLGGDRPDYAYREQLELVRSEHGTPSELIYAIAVGSFTGADDAAPDASVDGLLAALGRASDGAVANRVLARLVAEEHDLPGGLVAYAGGPFLGGADATNVGNRVLAVRSEGMRDHILHDLGANWFDRGGGLFMFSSLCAPYFRYRTFGLTDDITELDRNHQFEAIRTLLGDGS